MFGSPLPLCSTVQLGDALGPHNGSGGLTDTPSARERLSIVFGRLNGLKGNVQTRRPALRCLGDDVARP
jgi:hypothetical protein